MKTLLKLIAAAWLAVAAAAAQEETVQVRLQQGVIEGARSEAAGGRFFYTFRSIPFAKPPVGELRFKVEPRGSRDMAGGEKWLLVAPNCPQSIIRTGVPTHKGVRIVFTTVYTTGRCKPHESALPVMVWLHGGGFAGTSEDYPALPLLTKDVVLVTVQYRLGTLGFFSTEDSEALGNFGLRDQALALRWVQDNIRSLGGDPNTCGLFQRAIMQSGTTLCPWMVREGHKQVATKMSEIFNCSAVDENSSSSLDSAALVACLRDVPLDKLIVETLAYEAEDLPFDKRALAGKCPPEISATRPKILEMPLLGILSHSRPGIRRHSGLYLSNGPQVMVPRVDGEFVPDHPAVLLREGRFNKVDIISGVTQHEGALASIPYLANPPALDCLYQHFGENGPVSFGIEAWEDDPEYLARRAFHHYLGPLEVTEEKANEFTQDISLSAK
ncbi:acylcarnitine hydrolase-like [Penaeus japonicus]|uniref:acylcarnitine hydrolase-like n=1 Tax=Penaeus japonicus TaxID=27405 RepID=UPI001C713BAC|nr:acylcarnitine hydrolase-like [Penaeus japonicus]